MTDRATAIAGPSAAAVVSLVDVHKRFGSAVAVERATLEIRRGEFFSILGPSGCGKTTLLRMIAGFESVTGGRILLDGVDVAKVPPYRRSVNTVFQQYALFPHLNVFDNVAFGPRAKGLDEKETGTRVRAMLGTVRLGEFAGRRPDQLSGGQKQRVALARALVNFPSALLLDEPLSALDRELRQTMQLELKRIQRETGIAFVFVTHDQDEALAMSDRLAVMNNGRVAQVGTPEEIYRDPATAFVAGFFGAANLLPARVLHQRGEDVDVEICGDRCASVPAGGRLFATGQDAFVMVRPERVTVASSPPSSPERHCSLPVTVDEVSFQGPVLRCRMHGPGSDRLLATIDEHQRPDGLIPGARMWAAWDPSTARLLHQDGNIA